MVSRRFISVGYILALGTLAKPDILWANVSAQTVTFPAGQGVQSVSGVRPDSSGDVNFGCPLSPFNAGSNMGVNAMDSGCALHFVGPVETQAQSASDIANAISGLSSVYQPIGSYLTASALTPYLTTSLASSTYSTPASVSAAITAGLSPYLTSSLAASTYETQSALAATLAGYSNTSQMNAAIAAAAYTFQVGAPVSKSPTFGSALQATTPSKAATVTVNWTSTAALSLTGGTTNTATIGIASTSAAAITGSVVACTHSNSNTGALTIGLNLSTIMATTCSFNLPAGWYWSPKAVAGTVTISSAYDQAIG